MIKFPRGKGRRRFRRDAGMVLVIMLALIVLVTIAVMAFFTHATANRQVETSRSNRTEAELLARTGADYVTGLLRSEIIDYSDQDGGVFIPRTNASMVPRRLLSAAVALGDTNFANLLRQSSAASGGDINASSDNTATSSRNGRLINEVRWNKPELLVGGGFQATNQLPCWIYVTRDGGLTNIPNANVIGRFAYNVYDLSGLLNANVVGYDPNKLSLEDVRTLKASASGADLTQISGISVAAVTNLVNFRTSGSSESGSNYLSRVQASLSEGFTSSRVTNSAGAVFTNNHFTSRQDLLNYVRKQNLPMTNALPYLTHFSQNLSAPAWMPPDLSGSTNSSANYRAQATHASSVNRFAPSVYFAKATSIQDTADNIIHYNDDGTPYKADGIHDGYDVTTGDPLVNRKFSLAKLAWLSPRGIREEAFASGLISTQREAAVRACFGLTWDDLNECWNYVEVDTSLTSPQIKTLAEVADEKREPNFFELLKASILSGSLGGVASQSDVIEIKNSVPIYAKTLLYDTTMQQGHLSSKEGDYDLQSNKTLHILRIGANIIDCGDVDNYPTIISLHNPSTPPIDVQVAGIEDLPYMHCLSFWSMRQSVAVDSTNRKMTACDIIWIPEFFSPYRRSVTTDGPGSVEMNIPYGFLRYVGCNIGAGYPGKSFSSGVRPIVGVVSIPKGKFENFRAGPRPARAIGDPYSLGVQVPYATADLDMQVIPIFRYQTETWTASQWPFYFKKSTDASHFLQIDNLIIRMQYESPNGVLRTYSTFGGDPSFPDRSGIEGIYGDDNTNVKAWVKFWPRLPTNDGLSVTTLLANSVMYIAKWDSRSSRLGPSRGYARTVGSDPPTTGTTATINGGRPFLYPNVPANLQLGLKPEAGNTRDTNWPDPDGVFRPADGSWGANANPYKNLNDSDRRPILLQRPYKSVTELGYVFRDVPWKSLDFRDSSSSDSGLLEFFSVTDESQVQAGRVSINTPHAVVTRSLLSGSVFGVEGDGNASSSQIASVANLMQAYIYLNGRATSNAFLDVGRLADFVSTNKAALTAQVGNPIKVGNESTVSAIANSSQARTWNVLIDVVAQAGRFPAGSDVFTGEKFMVDGEGRQWTSIAIDRYTGKIISLGEESVSD